MSIVKSEKSEHHHKKHHRTPRNRDLLETMQDMNSNEPEVLNAAERTLAEFKASFETVYELSTSLFLSAKELNQKIHAILNEGRLRVDHGEMTVYELDEWLKQLLIPEKAKWDILFKEEAKLSKKLNEIYEPVKESEAAVIHARGEPPDVAWMGLPTEEQAYVRKAYHHKFKKAFAEAKREYDGLVGFPEGFLVRVHTLQHGAEKEEKDVLEKLHHRAESHAAVHAPQPEVLDEADVTLALYKSSFEVTYEKSTSLFRAAKTLYEEVHDVLNDGKIHVHHGDWTVDELEGRVMVLQSLQKTRWEKLLAEGEKLRQKADEIYEPVTKAEAAVLHSRGEPPNVAWMGFPTNEQADVRKAYKNKFKQAFAVAKLEYEGVAGFPDGLLTRVPHLKNGAEMEARGVIDKLRHRTHVDQILRIKIPTF